MARLKNSTTADTSAVAETIGLHCYPLERADADFDSLLEMVGDARPGLPGSYEELFHQVGLTSASAIPDFMLLLREPNSDVDALREERLERAIGVIYRPDAEGISHYFEAHLPDQFDALIHIDRTRAVEPLEGTAGWERGEPPETFPATM